MERKEITYGGEWTAVMQDAHALAATMTLEPGETEGGPNNRHPATDQWILVHAGSGVVIVEGAEHALTPGTLLRIDRGEAHELRNTGSEPLHTLSFYIPPLRSASTE
ncbi:MAG TPA: cupin domain-containing protein [Longimicrobium sp.]|nr:cupin domain-containing protein [Longimicrobium sp.]